MQVSKRSQHKPQEKTSRNSCENSCVSSRASRENSCVNSHCSSLEHIHANSYTYTHRLHLPHSTRVARKASAQNGFQGSHFISLTFSSKIARFISASSFMFLRSESRARVGDECGRHGRATRDCSLLCVGGACLGPTEEELETNLSISHLISRKNAKIHRGVKTRSRMPSCSCMSRKLILAAGP